MKIIKWFRRLYYQLIPTYKRLELKLCSYGEADVLIRQNAQFEDKTQHWVLAKEEDTNRFYGYVYIERKERITS